MTTQVYAYITDEDSFLPQACLYSETQQNGETAKYFALPNSVLATVDIRDSPAYLISSS